MSSYVLVSLVMIKLRCEEVFRKEWNILWYGVGGGI